ncbi:MAG: hypothetical protein WC976_06450 [Caldisericia bacterium]
MNRKTAREKIRKIEKQITKVHNIWLNELYSHGNLQQVLKYILSGQISVSRTILYWFSAYVISRLPFKQIESIRLREDATEFDITVKDSNCGKDVLMADEYILLNLIAYGIGNNEGYRKSFQPGKKYLVADLMAKIKKTVHAS